jgi:hypothetical protein
MKNAVKINLEEGQYSYSLQTSDQYGNPIVIPVIDVRDGIAHREVADHMIKKSNTAKGSKYIRASIYNGGQPWS